MISRPGLWQALAVLLTNQLLLLQGADTEPCWLTEAADTTLACVCHAANACDLTLQTRTHAASISPKSSINDCPMTNGSHQCLPTFFALVAE